MERLTEQQRELIKKMF